MADEAPVKIDTPNCYPECSDNNIRNHLLWHNPVIDISVLRTSMLLQDEAKGNQSVLKYFQELFQGFHDEKVRNDGIITGIDNHVGVLTSLYGFLSLLSAHTEATCQNIPVFSSPNIKIDNSNGWKESQSLFSFIQSLTSNGAIGQLVKGLGAEGIVSGVVGGLEMIAQFTGWDPQVSPYFSFQNNPFSSKPELAVQLQLINDTEENAEKNANFLDVMIKNSLIGSEESRQTYGHSYSTYPILNKWYPPKLFTVGLRFGKMNTFCKIFHLCTLSAGIEPKGIIHDNGIPDAYTVEMTFRSILPDTLDAWCDGEFPNPFGENKYAGELGRANIDLNESITRNQQQIKKMIDEKKAMEQAENAQNPPQK